MSPLLCLYYSAFFCKKKKKRHPDAIKMSHFLIGTLETTRTFDPLLRRQMLYPAELRGHRSVIYIKYNLSFFQANI